MSSTFSIAMLNGTCFWKWSAIKLNREIKTITKTFMVVKYTNFVGSEYSEKLSGINFGEWRFPRKVSVSRNVLLRPLVLMECQQELFINLYHIFQ